LPAPVVPLEEEDEVYDDEEEAVQQPLKKKGKDKEEDDDLVLVEDDAPRQAVETTLANVKMAVEINTSYLTALLGAEQYLRAWGGVDQQKRLAVTKDKIIDTLRALEDLPLPVTRTVDPIVAKPPAPEIPVADGTEVRFTEVRGVFPKIC
jgi:hypothetical protein